ncbi:hypothetical protein [Sphingomonas jatrophae]|uniref:Lipoprotein n=1 Tax=Sphingomonas jatrophae TaxID=1166337 RepID=A0A1I6JV36_9SPHN|nr:hypothetical protein [Sphingomonas jatrophae]SFR82781.1 hypothetical protein SAMN05192580_0919 [Sphingomonas jatrophae]
MRILLILAAAALTSGCVRTAASVVTAPFKVAGQTADWLTTSQDEADRNYGRKMRKKEAREAREMRKRQKEEAERRRRRDDD